MATVIEVVHVMIALALIGLVLIQKSEGGGLGIGGGGGMSGFMTGRGQANLLTRVTGFLIGALILSSLTLTWLHGTSRSSGPSLLDQLPATTESKPGTPLPTPSPPAAPAVPLAK